MLSRCLSIAAFVLLVGCASKDGSTGAGAPDASAVAPADGGGVDSAGGSPVVDAAPGTGARLFGVIKRTAIPQGDAAGSVYVALFDRDPVANTSTAQVVGRALIESANLAAAGASVPYMLENVPPRADPYFLVAFLDDNGNVDVGNPNSAGPDRGDLVSLDGVAAPKVTVATAGDHPYDIDLNLVMPF